METGVFGAPRDIHLEERLTTRSMVDPMALAITTIPSRAADGRIVIVGFVKHGTMVTFPNGSTRNEMTVVGSRASVGCFRDGLDLSRRERSATSQIATRLRV